MSRRLAASASSNNPLTRTRLASSTPPFSSLISWPSSRSKPPKPKERVLILGSGWAGYALARTLSPSTHHCAIISPRSHFVFTPLLASTTVGTLEFRTVLEPVRRLGLDVFHEGYADTIDLKTKTVWVRPHGPSGDDAMSSSSSSLSSSPTTTTTDTRCDRFAVPYDRLVFAIGAYPQTFNIPGVREHANLLRTGTDARRIRLRLLSLFEHASRPDVPDALRRKLLHFAVVGGGPTGVEFAAELYDLVHEDLPRLYPDLVPLVNITVFDVAPTVLPMFERDLASYATEVFRRQGIRVRTEAMIQAIVRAGDDPTTTTQEAAQEEDIGLLTLNIKQNKPSHSHSHSHNHNHSHSSSSGTENGTENGAQQVHAGIVVWSTGLAQNPLLSRLQGVRKDAKTGGILTDQHMRALADDGTSGVVPDVYAIGDCAVVEGKNYPATAQVANQQAIYLGKQLNMAGGDGPNPFKFRNLGVMAYIGSWRAIHQSGADELKGRAAWILWRTAYLTKSMSFRNKILVPVYWAMTWLFGRDISRF